MQPELVKAHIKLLKERVNLKSEIEALEKELRSQHIEFPQAEQATVENIDVENIDTYYQINDDIIKQLEERRKQLEKIKLSKIPLSSQPPIQQLNPFFSPHQPKLNPVQVIDLNKKFKKKESEVEELKKRFPNVRLPQFKYFPGATIQDVIRNFKVQKAILEKAALANPPIPPQPPQTQQDKFVKLLQHYNETKELEKQVNELRKKYPKVRVPILKGNYEDQIKILEEQKAILERAAALATPPTPPKRRHNLKIIYADNFSQDNQKFSLKLRLPICGLQAGDQIKNVGGNKNINITLPEDEYKTLEEVVIYYSESETEIQKRIHDDQRYDEEIVRNGVTMECTKDGSLKVVVKQDMTSPAQIVDEFLPEQNPQDLYKKLLVVQDKDGHQKAIEALYNDEYSVKDAYDGTIYSAHQIIRNYDGVWPPQMRWQPDSPDLETAAALATPPQRHMTNPATIKVPDTAVKDAVEKAVKERNPKIDLEGLSKYIEKYKTALPVNPLYEFAKVIISLIQTLKDPNETNSKWRQYLLSDFRIALTHFKKRSVLTLLFNEIKEKYKMLNKGKDDESAVSIIEELKPWICDELYDYQKSIKTMTSLQSLTLENIPDSNDYSHEFVKKKNNQLLQEINKLKQSNAKVLPKAYLDQFVKEIQAEIKRTNCPVRSGGKTLRRRQMKTTRTRTTVPREKGLRKRATIGQKKKQKQTRTRN
jgi:hypothetical protein